MKKFISKKKWFAFLLIAEMVSFNLPLASIFAIAEETASVDFPPFSLPPAAAINPQTQYVMWQDDFTVSTHAVDLSSISFAVRGSIASSDISNLTLYRGDFSATTSDAAFVRIGQTISTLPNAPADFPDTHVVTFIFPTPIRFEIGTHTLKLVGDIVSGNNRVFFVSLEQAADVNFSDSVSGMAIVPTVFNTGFRSITAGTQTINVGTLTIATSPDSLSGNIPKNASGAVFAKFTLTATGEPIKIDSLKISVTKMGAVPESDANSFALRNGTLFANGVRVGGTLDINEVQNIAGGGTTFILGSSLIINPETPVILEIHADAYNTGSDSIQAGDTLQMNIMLGVGSLLGMRSLARFSNPAVSGGVLTVVDAPEKPVSTGSIRVCKIIADQNGNISDGVAHSGSFAVDGSLPSTHFATPLVLNADLIGNDGINDAQCITYNNLALSSYTYGEESIDGIGWSLPLYNDQDDVIIGSLSDFFPYDSSVDETRNKNSDGLIILTADKPNRTLIVLNGITQNTQPQCPAITSSWVANVQYPGAPAQPVPPDTAIKDGRAYIPIQSGGYWTNFNLDLPAYLDGDNMRIDVRLKAPYSEGSIWAHDPAVVVYGASSSAAVQWMGEAGAISWTGIYAGDTRVTGGLSGLVQNFDDWHVVSLDLQNHTESALYDSNPAYSMPYTGSVGALNKLLLSFKGSASVDWVKIYDKDGVLKFVEDFNVDGQTTAHFVCSVLPPVNTAPSITMNGDSIMALNIGDTFTDPGATATDTEDGSISPVIITGSVNTSVAGTYMLRYNVTDSKGLVAQEKTRTVVVFEDSVGEYHIRDNATGGDCSLIGIWDIATKTCRLTQDLNHLIQGIGIDNDGIIFDGNGHTITGTWEGLGISASGAGVELSGRSLSGVTNVTVKNLHIEKFGGGIVLLNSTGNTLSGNTISNNFADGITLFSSNGNILTDNTANSNGFGGILLASSTGNILTGNTANRNQSAGIFLDVFSNGNTLAGNTASDNNGGGPNGAGIVLKVSDNNTVTGNTVSNNNADGLSLISASNNKIYRNNFIDNTAQVKFLVDDNGDTISGNVFDFPSPLGGNYWSDYDTSAEGCTDANSDGICDASHVFTGGQDNLPWTVKNGWLASTTPINTAPIITLNGEATLRFTVGGTFTDPGATATDAEDGYISPVIPTSTVNPYVVGVYTIKYNIFDSKGLAAQEKTRTVIVDPAPSGGGGGSYVVSTNNSIAGANQTGLVLGASTSATNTTTSPTTNPIKLPTAPFVFTRDLTIGSTGEDVRQLQIYLNTHGFPVATSGAGSSGNETTTFGTLTQTALSNFQKANNISPTNGYFGAITRAFINNDTKPVGQVLSGASIVASRANDNFPTVSITAQTKDDIYHEGIDFEVIYKDADNNPPSYIKVFVNNLEYAPKLDENNPIWIYSNKDYTDSEKYIYHLDTPAKGNYTYYAKVSDGAHETKSGNETVLMKEYQCNDGIDNDGDGKVDDADFGCSSKTDNKEYSVYVSLGDSYSSGIGVPPYFSGTYEAYGTGPNNCRRSTSAYSEIVAKELGMATSSHACQGAVTANYFASRLENNTTDWGEKAQKDYLSDSTELVTLTIGGNDLGFADIAFDCYTHGYYKCGDIYYKQVNDAIARLNGETQVLSYDDIFQSIKKRAPNAKVVIIGYPHLFAETNTGACGTMLIYSQQWINNAIDKLNAVIKKKAEDKKYGFLYVNLSTPVYSPNSPSLFSGHELCGKDGEWILSPLVDNPVTAGAVNTIIALSSPVYGGVSFKRDGGVHPTKEGHKAIADAIISALNAGKKVVNQTYSPYYDITVNQKTYHIKYELAPGKTSLKPFEGKRWFYDDNWKEVNDENLTKQIAFTAFAFERFRQPDFTGPSSISKQTVEHADKLLAELKKIDILEKVDKCKVRIPMMLLVGPSSGMSCLQSQVTDIVFSAPETVIQIVAFAKLQEVSDDGKELEGLIQNLQNNQTLSYVSAQKMYELMFRRVYMDQPVSVSLARISGDLNKTWWQSVSASLLNIVSELISFSASIFAGSDFISSSVSVGTLAKTYTAVEATLGFKSALGQTKYAGIIYDIISKNEKALDSDYEKREQDINNQDTRIGKWGECLKNHDYSSACINNFTLEQEQPPTITLNGENPTYVKIGGTFIDPVKATNSIGKDITADIKKTVSVDTKLIGAFGAAVYGSGVLSGTPNTAVAGTYLIHYNVTDPSNNLAAAEATRTVVVGATTILPQCSDKIDNDGDGKIDYPNDPGCTSTADTDEFNVVAPIVFIFNNDLWYGSASNPVTDVLELQKYLNGHGYPVATTGAGSPGYETTYFGLATQAALINFQTAKGISPAAGYFGSVTRAFINYNTPSPAVVLPVCSDGKDNDGDGKVDYPNDIGCMTTADADEYNDPIVPPVCSDGIDNDSDGLRDYPSDPGCASSTDGDEYNAPIILSGCSNGKDDDGDGKVDYPNDPGCTSTTDTDEYNAVVSSNFIFNNDLSIGVTHSDVLQLQKYLNGHGYLIASSGSGSPGNETTYFGALTQTAVAKFQTAKGISPAAGYFGSVTRAYVNSHW